MLNPIQAVRERRERQYESRWRQWRAREAAIEEITAGAPRWYEDCGVVTRLWMKGLRPESVELHLRNCPACAPLFDNAGRSKRIYPGPRDVGRRRFLAAALVLVLAGGGLAVGWQQGWVGSLFAVRGAAVHKAGMQATQLGSSWVQAIFAGRDEAQKRLLAEALVQFRLRHLYADLGALLSSPDIRTRQSVIATLRDVDPADITDLVPALQAAATTEPDTGLRQQIAAILAAMGE